MRTLTYYIAVTLDGFIAAPDGSFDFYTFQGDHMDAINAVYPETIPTHLREALGVTDEGTRFDTVLMGRGTYEVGLHEGVTSPYAHLRQYVVSTSLTVDDPAVEVISHDAVARVGKLKRQKGRGIWLCGGGKLAATLRDDIDELVLKINPVIIGTGIPLFDRGFGPDQFVLTASRVFNSGVAFMTYARR